MDFAIFGEAETAAKAVNSLNGFARLWKFRTGSDEELDEVFRYFAYNATFQFDSLQERLVDFVVCYREFCPADIDRLDPNSWHTLMFCFSAYKHGYDAGYQEICMVAAGLWDMLKNTEEADFRKWLQFFIWALAGTYYAADAGAKGEPTVSKLLDLDEFRGSLPFEQVVEKDPGSHFVFISHRWLEKHHPDPGGDQKGIIVARCERAQKFLDYILDPSTMPNIAESDFEATQGELANTIFDGELRWSVYFFARCQPKLLLWYDYYSVPQGGDVASRELRGACMAEIAQLCRSMPVFAISSPDYFARGWCFFESLQSLLGNSELLFCENDQASSNNVTMREVLKDCYGRFCREMEQRRSPSNVLATLGIACTNGSDLDYLSDILEKDSAKGNYGITTFGFVAHPYLTAYRKFIHEVVSQSDKSSNEWGALVSMFEYFHGRVVNSVPTPDDTIAQREEMEEVTLRWNYPGYGTACVLEMKEDWENAPSFAEDVHSLFELMKEMAKESTLGLSVLEFADNEYPRFKVQLEEALARTSGFPVQICTKNE